MKKIILLIYTVSVLIISGCYDDSKNANIRINLGGLLADQKVEQKSIIDRILLIFSKEAYAQTVPQDLLRIHIGIYSGSTLNDKKIIDIANIPVSQIIEFEVSAGDNRTVLVVGENNLNQAGYYGYNNVNLRAGETADVTVSMQSADWVPIYGQGSTYARIFAVDNSTVPYKFSWTGSGVKTRYYVEEAFTGIPVYSGPGFEAVYSGGEYSFNLYIEFSDFGLKTPAFNLNFG